MRPHERTILELERGKKRLAEKMNKKEEKLAAKEAKAELKEIKKDEPVSLTIKGFKTVIAEAPLDAEAVAEAPVEMPATEPSLAVQDYLAGMELPAAEVAAAPVFVVEEDGAATRLWSRDELHAVSEQEGLAGLRAIAGPMGIKGRGKDELIEEILKAQAPADEEPAPSMPEEQLDIEALLADA